MNWHSVIAVAVAVLPFVLLALAGLWDVAERRRYRRWSEERDRRWYAATARWSFACDSAERLPAELRAWVDCMPSDVRAAVQEALRRPRHG